MTINGTPSRAISTAWAWRSWCGANLRRTPALAARRRNCARIDGAGVREAPSIAHGRLPRPPGRVGPAYLQNGADHGSLRPDLDVAATADAVGHSRRATALSPTTDCVRVREFRFRVRGAAMGALATSAMEERPAGASPPAYGFS